MCRIVNIRIHSMPERIWTKREIVNYNSFYPLSWAQFTHSVHPFAWTHAECTSGSDTAFSMRLPCAVGAKNGNERCISRSLRPVFFSTANILASLVKNGHHPDRRLKQSILNEGFMAVSPSIVTVQYHFVAIFSLDFFLHQRKKHL